jgi:hypothetical protein
MFRPLHGDQFAVVPVRVPCESSGHLFGIYAFPLRARSTMTSSDHDSLYLVLDPLSTLHRL